MYSTACNIYDYHDFRKYLADAIEDLRFQCVGFSFRNFSKVAGLGSPNFLILLTKGERNLSKKTASKIAKAFGMDQLQCLFFENLVMYNQARIADDKISYAHEIVKIRSQLKSYQLQCSEFHYYSKWFNIAIKEVIQTTPGISSNQIFQTLVPKVSREEINESLEILLRLNFIEKNEAGYRSRIDHILTGDKFISAAVVEFHKNMIHLSEESLDRFKTEERDVTAVTTGLSRANFLKAREKIKQLRQEILAMSESNQHEKEVFQLNIQLFPLTKNQGAK